MDKWQAGSRGVTFGGRDVLVTDRDMPVNAAKFLASSLNNLDLRPAVVPVIDADLRGALRRMVDTFRPFTSKPVGAPHSQARADQDEQIEAHAEARKLLGGQG